MANEISKCFSKWARLIRPNQKLAVTFMNKARNDLVVLRSIPDSDMEWRATTLYYARYHMLTALLMRIGIDCKDHNCSILIAESAFLGMMKKELFDEIKTAKKHRINLQYYTDRAVDKKEFEKNLGNVDRFVEQTTILLQSLTREKAEEIKKKFELMYYGEQK
jgi:uncharacterized protein (UPF0332 family)